MTRFTHQLSPKIAQKISIAGDTLGLIYFNGRIDWIFEDWDTDSFSEIIFNLKDGGRDKMRDSRTRSREKTIIWFPAKGWSRDMSHRADEIRHLGKWK